MNNEAGNYANGGDNGMEIISPMLDVMFKRMFSMSGSAPMLSDFLETYLDLKGKDLTNIKLIDKEIKRFADDKASLLDLRVEAGNSEIDVEVQLIKLEGDRNRFSLYLTKMFSDQISEGMSYDKMHNCKSLLILDYTMPEYDGNDDFCHTFKMRDENGVVFSDALEIDVVEIPRIRGREIRPETDKRILWARLLAATSEEELNMIADVSDNSAIKQAVLTVKKLSADQEMRLEATARMKEINDRIALYDTGKAEGRAEGKAEGKAEERNAFINVLRVMGMDEDSIKEAVQRVQNTFEPTATNAEEPYTNQSEDDDDWDMGR